MKLKYLMKAIAIALSALIISACQSGPSYDHRPAYSDKDHGGGNSGGGSSGY